MSSVKLPDFFNEPGENPDDYIVYFKKDYPPYGQVQEVITIFVSVCLYMILFFIDVLSRLLPSLKRISNYLSSVNRSIIHRISPDVKEYLEILHRPSGATTRIDGAFYGASSQYHGATLALHKVRRTTAFIEWKNKVTHSSKGVL